MSGAAEQSKARLCAAVVGVDGAVGAEMAAAIAREDEFEAVLGLDAAPAYSGRAPAKLKYQPVPASDAACGDAFKSARVKVAVYLSPFPSAQSDGAARLDDLADLKRFLAACEACGAEAIAVTTGATIYGARSENPSFFAEGAPLKPSGLRPGELDLARERLCADFARRNKSVSMAVCRLAPVIGPGTRGLMSRFLEAPKFMVLEGFDPPVQFLHAEDVAYAVLRLLKLRRTGVYNIAPDDYTTFLQLGRTFKKPLARVSPRMARLKTWIGSLLGGVPADFLPLLQFPILLTNRKLKRDTGYTFKYGSEQALAHHAKHDAQRA